MPSAEGNALLLVFQDPLDKAGVDAEAHMAELKKAISQCIKKDVEIRTVCRNAGDSQKQDWVDLSQFIKVNIEYED